MRTFFRVVGGLAVVTLMASSVFAGLPLVGVGMHLYETVEPLAGKAAALTSVGAASLSFLAAVVYGILECDWL